jgi:uncharacterized protein (TIGR00730 family)
MKYRMNDPEIDGRIADLVQLVAGPDSADKDTDLVSEIIVTALKLLRDETDRADTKMMNTALKELRYSSRVFAPHRGMRKIAVYGSARTPPDHPDYLLAEEFGRRMAEDEGWMVITGAGPGIMEAVNKGAGSDASFGVNIRLPFENGANEYLSPGKVVNFKYFFTRKVQFVKESDAFALFPGGWGTMDEAFELLTLVQTGKSDMHPIVMVEAEGSTYWDPWDDLCRSLLDKGMISPPDLGLYRIVDTIDEAIAEVIHFFRVYHSQRYVEGDLVLRLQRAIPDSALDTLNTDFHDILTHGDIVRSSATDAEVASDDHVDLPRLRFAFDRRSFGRLRALIDALNDAPD